MHTTYESHLRVIIVCVAISAVTACAPETGDLQLIDDTLATAEQLDEIQNVSEVLLAVAHSYHREPTVTPPHALRWHVVTADKLPDPDCKCVAQTRFLLDGSADVWLTMVDDMTRKPTDSLSASPALHEWTHIYFGDPKHTDTQLWGPIFSHTFNALNSTNYAY